MVQIGFHLTDFSEILFMNNFFWKSVKKIQVSLKSDQNNEYFTWRPVYVYDNTYLNSS
jgi:hypothetical protein